MDWQQVLGELVGFVKEAAPAVWMIYRRQVVVQVLQYGLWAVTAAIASVALFRLGKRVAKLDEYDADLFATMAYFCFAIAVVLSITFVCNVLGRVVNPDYYIIEMMLSALNVQ